MPQPCPLCQGKRLKREALAVTFAGLDIAELSHLSLQALAEVFRKVAAADYLTRQQDELTLEKRLAAQRIAKELLEAH
jgi:excinuclease ABC subunit A